MTALSILEHEARAARRVLGYQAQDSPMTLAQGLAEYYAANAGRVTPPQMLAPESAALFRGHDICHVIFGLDTTFADEAVVDARAMLASDVGWARYANYLRANPDAQAIFQQVGWLRTAWATVLTTPRLFKALVARGRKRWPWRTPESLMDRPLGELRAEYGIRVI